MARTVKVCIFTAVAGTVLLTVICAGALAVVISGTAYSDMHILLDASSYAQLALTSFVTSCSMGTAATGATHAQIVSALASAETALTEAFGGGVLKQIWNAELLAFSDDRFDFLTDAYTIVSHEPVYLISSVIRDLYKELFSTVPFFSPATVTVVEIRAGTMFDMLSSAREQLGQRLANRDDRLITAMTHIFSISVAILLVFFAGFAVFAGGILVRLKAHERHMSLLVRCIPSPYQEQIAHAFNR
jgi:hypothetical protein